MKPKPPLSCLQYHSQIITTRHNDLILLIHAVCVGDTGPSLSRLVLSVLTPFSLTASCLFLTDQDLFSFTEQLFAGVVVFQNILTVVLISFSQCQQENSGLGLYKFCAHFRFYFRNNSAVLNGPFLFSVLPTFALYLKGFGFESGAGDLDVTSVLPGECSDSK
jgi:hypothetical protein